MAFKDDTLEFFDNKIVDVNQAEVMMDWEAPIMEKAAEFICHNKGDILEIGFGMGICADYIGMMLIIYLLMMEYLLILMVMKIGVNSNLLH